MDTTNRTHVAPDLGLVPFLNNEKKSIKSEANLDCGLPHQSGWPRRSFPYLRNISTTETEKFHLGLRGYLYIPTIFSANENEKSCKLVHIVFSTSFSASLYLTQWQVKHAVTFLPKETQLSYLKIKSIKWRELICVRTAFVYLSQSPN
jgi:hypothetical protein